MLKRMLAAGVSCALLFSLTTPALAIRAGGGTPKAAGQLDTTQIVLPSSDRVAFDQIEGRIRANNLTIKSAQESLQQVKSMDWDKVIRQAKDGLEDLEDLIDATESGIASMTSAATQTLAPAVANLQKTLQNIASAETMTDEMIAALGNSIVSVSAASSASTYSQMQLPSLQSSLASLEAQRDSLDDQITDLKEQKEDYQKTIQDTERQIDYAIHQTVAGAQSLYLTILSTELQLASLKDTKTSTARTLQEMELRYQLGQISQQTLLQVHNGYDTLEATVDNLVNTIGTMKSSLQSLMGETPTGTLTLEGTPAVSAETITAINYATDLETAKKNSYSLYSAARSVENAEDDRKDAQKDNGKNSYQYKMAEHAYQSAVYQQTSAIASFQLSFQNLYRALAPAQATLAVKEADLAYQEQVYAAAELKHTQGNLSDNGLLAAKNALESAKRDVASAKLDLFTAYHAYEQAVTLGLVSSAG